MRLPNIKLLKIVFLFGFLTFILSILYSFYFYRLFLFVNNYDGKEFFVLENDLNVNYCSPMFKSSSRITPKYPIRIPLFKNVSLNFTCLNENKTIKFTILVWNDFYSGFLENPFVKEKCPVQNCRISTNRTELFHSELVFVHMSQLANNFEKLPQHRPKNQRWIFGIYETPINSKDFSIYDGYFNFTSTYSINSDFPGYGFYIYSNKMKEFNKSNDYLGGKKELAFAMISNCGKYYQTSLRMEYIKELKKYIKVDVYGKCGIPCPYNNSICRFELFKNYKFVLAFENSLCNDYITEKFYHAINYDIVPVVLGKGNYSNYVRHSSNANLFN
jgi:alpha-1,3-fucosyltransferase